MHRPVFVDTASFHWEQGLSTGSQVRRMVEQDRWHSARLYAALDRSPRLEPRRLRQAPKMLQTTMRSIHGIAVTQA